MLVTGDEGESIPLLCTRLARGSDKSAPGPLQLLLLQPRLPAVGCTKNSESSDGCSFQSSSATQNVKTFHIRPHICGTERVCEDWLFQNCTVLIFPSAVCITRWIENWGGGGGGVRVNLDAEGRKNLSCLWRRSNSDFSFSNL
jgi:hypothetical protein